MQLIKSVGLNVLEKDGKKFVVFKNKVYPMEFAWFLVAKSLEEKGYTVSYVYGGKREASVRWAFDSENGVAPLEPDKIEVYKVEGEPFDKTVKTLVIDLNRPPDPDPQTSLELLSLDGF